MASAKARSGEPGLRAERPHAAHQRDDAPPAAAEARGDPIVGALALGAGPAQRVPEAAGVAVGGAEGLTRAPCAGRRALTQPLALARSPAQGPAE